MWWLDPGKDVLNVVRSLTVPCLLCWSFNSRHSQVFNRILAPYVENLDMNQVNYGIAQGSFSANLATLVNSLYSQVS